MYDTKMNEIKLITNTLAKRLGKPNNTERANINLHGDLELTQAAEFE